MSNDGQEVMDKCPIDGNFFVPKAGKKVCSPECKKLWDSQNRRQRKLAEKIEQERAEATEKANREAANARRRRARAEAKAKADAAKRAELETSETTEALPLSKAQIIISVAVIVLVLLLIWGLPNGR